MICLSSALLILPNWFPTWLYQFICMRAHLPLTNIWYFYTFRFCKFDGWEILYHYNLNLLFMTAKEVEHLYCSVTQLVGYWPLFPLLPAHVASSIFFFSHFFIFKLGCLSFSHWFFGSFYLFRIIMFVSFELQIISQSVFFSFLFIVSFAGQKFLMLTNFSLRIYYRVGLSYIHIIKIFSNFF